MAVSVIRDGCSAPRPPTGAILKVDYYRANSTARISRMRVTLTSPG